MHINVTLFIQIGNFLITYYLLDRWLFKPLIASIQKKQKAKNKLLKNIQSEESELLALQKTKLEKLKHFQEESHQGISPIMHYTPSHKAQEIPIQEINNKTIEELKEEMKKLIIEKIPHEY
jgi:F0F1-type ATP synthase membrane subunit b/b'